MSPNFLMFDAPLQGWALRSWSFAATVIVFLTAGPAYCGEPPAHGAAAIEEVHGDWTVFCRPRGGERVCAVRQIQAQKQSGKPVLLIELRASADGAAKGGVMLPNSLRRDAGVRLALDAAAAARPANQGLHGKRLRGHRDIRGSGFREASQRQVFAIAGDEKRWSAANIRRRLEGIFRSRRKKHAIGAAMK